MSQSLAINSVVRTSLTQLSSFDQSVVANSFALLQFSSYFVSSMSPFETIAMLTS